MLSIKILTNHIRSRIATVEDFYLSIVFGRILFKRSRIVQRDARAQKESFQVRRNIHLGQDGLSKQIEQRDVTTVQKYSIVAWQTKNNEMVNFTLTTGKEKDGELIEIEMGKEKTIECTATENATDFQWFKVSTRNQSKCMVLISFL